MPYPFAPAMSFGDLKELLESNYGCEFVEKDELTNHHGEKFRICVVKRKAGDKLMRRTVQMGEDDEMVNPNVLRATCKRLNIDVRDFPGFHLG